MTSHSLSIESPSIESPTDSNSTMPTMTAEDGDGSHNENTNESDCDTDPSPPSTDSSSEPQFHRFSSLPPELRHHIWRLAIPSPGINFFNVHCFPFDHIGCNRSTSPCWAYLDLRRLDIEDEDDEVALYDPSSWQARYAVRQSCHEARVICAIPAEDAATITLTRPRRGLYVRAGDGQLRRETPSHIPRNYEKDDDDDDDDVDTNNPVNPANNNENQNHNSNSDNKHFVEPVVRRFIEVHKNDILNLSVENCSFNLPHEEHASSSSNDDDDDDDDDDIDVLSSTPANFSFDENMGWAYDPQLTPSLPSSIPPDRLCVNLARNGTTFPIRLSEPLFDILYGHILDYSDLPAGAEGWPDRLLVMVDALPAQAIDEYDDLTELNATPEIVRDRFGDRYVRLLRDLPIMLPPIHWPEENRGVAVLSHLTKVAPESNNLRHRYLQSACLRSPKRPAHSY